VKLDDMTDPEQQAEMHDYRKQLRGILAIGSQMPVWNITVETQAAVAILTMAYDGLGKVEDGINAYVFQTEHGDKSDIKSAEEALATRWTDLVKQLKTTDLLASEAALIDNIV